MMRKPTSAAMFQSRRTCLKCSWKVMLAIAVGGISLAPTKTFAQPTKGKSGRKALVLYHSRTGNTRALARQIHEAVGGDLVEIQTVQPYPDDYDAMVAQNAEEQRTNYMPPLRTTIDNIQDYDVVFIGLYRLAHLERQAHAARPQLPIEP
jgi:Flavodoxin domain